MAAALMSQPPSGEHQFPCTDAFGRDKTVVLKESEDGERLVLLAPEFGAATLKVGAALDLRDAITERTKTIKARNRTRLRNFGQGGENR